MTDDMEIEHELEVYVCDDYMDDPSSVKITLDIEEIKEYLSLMRKVAELEVYKIVDWYGIEWDQSEGSEDFRTECDVFDIKENSVQFRATIKHTNIEVYTEEIFKEELEENVKIYEIPRDQLPLHIHDLKYDTSKRILERRLKGVS